jgi:hypothetical protein
VPYWYDRKTGTTYWERPLLPVEQMLVKEGGTGTCTQTIPRHIYIPMALQESTYTGVHAADLQACLLCPVGAVVDGDNEPGETEKSFAGASVVRYNSGDMRKVLFDDIHNNTVLFGRPVSPRISSRLNT